MSDDTVGRISLVSYLQATAPSFATELTRERLAAMSEIAALRDELGRTNEALAACQSEAAGQIAELRGRHAALRDAARKVVPFSRPSFPSEKRALSRLAALLGKP